MKMFTGGSTKHRKKCKQSTPEAVERHGSNPGNEGDVKEELEDSRS